MKLFSENRKVAEVWSYVISLVLVGTTFGYLIYVSMTMSNNSYLAFKTTVLWEKSRDVNGRLIVPVRITNTGHRTPTKAIFRIEKSGEKIGELALEYLGRNSSKLVYLSVAEKSDLEIKLDQYQF